MKSVKNVCTVLALLVLFTASSHALELEAIDQTLTWETHKAYGDVNFSNENNRFTLTADGTAQSALGYFFTTLLPVSAGSGTTRESDNSGAQGVVGALVVEEALGPLEAGFSMILGTPADSEKRLGQGRGNRVRVTFSNLQLIVP